MCHHRFALRLLNEEGEVLWMDTVSLYADCKIAIHDLDNDGADEIVVERINHGRKKQMLLLKRRPVSESGGDPTR